MARENDLSEEKREEMVVWAMDHYGEEIKRLIYTYVRNYAVIDDLSQEVFVKVYKNLHLFRGDSELKTWIYRIAINISKDYLRSFKHKVKELVQPFLAGGELTDEKVLISEERQELAAVVMSLPLKYREVLILHYYKDFTVEEISELLEVNKNTVKTRLKRGRDKVRVYIMEGGDEHEQESSTRKQSL